MSNTLVTPSAKSHERITGRWVRDIEVATSREWAVYYLKQIVGTPIPYLLWAYAALAFFTRAGIEIAAWGAALLTLLYVFADRLSKSKEFTFFRVGADFFLLGFVIVGIIGAFNTATTYEALASLGGVRWVILLYLVAYALELFPGLNRIYTLMILSAAFASGYGIWQHFTGLDLIRGVALAPGPISSVITFTSTGFFGTPEVFATVLAMILPFPAATFLLNEGRDTKWRSAISLLVLLLFTVALFCTYRPGLWMTAGVSIIVLGLLSLRRLIWLLVVLGITAGSLLYGTYGDPAAVLTSVEKSDIARGENQRAQINTQVKLWQENPWIGVGHRAREAADYDPGTGNVYFQVLAQTGVLGAIFYLLFLLGFLLLTYRVFHEIPRTHYWHRVFIAGALGSQLAFHMAGLYWSTLAEAVALNLFVLVLASVGYLVEHYNRGLVPDDRAL